MKILGYDYGTPSQDFLNSHVDRVWEEESGFMSSHGIPETYVWKGLPEWHTENFEN